MKIAGTHYRTIWVTEPGTVRVIRNQSRLPFEFASIDLETLGDAARAIKTMRWCSGAPLIGATRGKVRHGALAARTDPSDSHLAEAAPKPTSDPTNCDQSGLGVEENAQSASGSSAARASRCGISGSRRNLRCRRRAVPLRLAFTAWRSSVDLPKPPAESSTFSRIATPVGLRALIGALRLRPLYMAHDAGIPVHVCRLTKTRPAQPGRSTNSHRARGALRTSHGHRG